MQARLKAILGQVPAAALIYDSLKPRRPRTRYNLEQLADRIPAAVDQTRPYAAAAAHGRRLILFATLHYWIEQAAIVGLTLRGLGHDVAIAYLPYSNWEKEINPFDFQRQDLYTRRVLAPLDGLVDVISLKETDVPNKLPDELDMAMAAASENDVMYSLQTEQVDRDSPLYRLRLERNTFACKAALEVLDAQRPDAVLIPNGLVTELGVFFQAARFREFPTITYEFSDQREQIWLAQDDIVMQQNTDDLWRARGSVPLTAAQRETISAFEDARQNAVTYGKGTRRWQDAPRQGGDRLRAQLGLDGRPIALLATNVLGDSLTLGRNIFARSMAEWIERTVVYFAGRSDAQLVVRVHPGERLIRGPSMLRVIEGAVPGKPSNIHVVGPTESTNTYDLMEIADLGLAYTTTVGLEMAMRGVPVIVAGKTHYRDRGFTMAPRSWLEYFRMLDEVLGDPRSSRLREGQVEAAWNYGYRFFFDYPLDFPWRLMHFWRDIDVWPVGRVLSDEGMRAFGRTFRYLAGERIEW